MLLDKGAHVRAMTRSGETPEDFASAAGHEEVTHVLYQVQISTNMFVLVCNYWDVSNINVGFRLYRGTSLIRNKSP